MSTVPPEGTPVSSESVGSIVEIQQTVAGQPPAPAQGRGRLVAFLAELLRFQCKSVAAPAGIIALASSGARAGGVVARHIDPAAAALTDPAELERALTPGITTVSPSASGSPIAPVAAQHPLLARLESAAARAMAQASTPGAQPIPGVIERVALPAPRGSLYDPSAGGALALAAPLTVAGRPEGAVVVIVPSQSQASAERALATLALTCARFETFVWQQQSISETEHKLKLRETLELLDAANQGKDAGSMGALLCEELRRRFGCSRVSLGLVGGKSGTGDRVRLVAVSGADIVDPNTAAVEAIELAMEECADQDAEVAYPAPPELEHDPMLRRVARCAERLSVAFGPSSVLSLPLRVEGQLTGVMVLERDARDPFPAASIPLVRLVAEFIGPALWTRRLADRGVLAVTKDRALAFARAAAGPRHTVKKLVSSLALLVALALALPVVPVRTHAEATVSPRQARVIVPPFDGLLAEVLVRPGDSVDKGQPLAQMDSAELMARQSELQARFAQTSTELEAARNAGELAQVRLVEAMLDELRAGLASVELDLARAQIKAPIAGTVARGNLDPFVGARVNPSQPLMEIVAGGVVVDLAVDEREIQHVREGAIAELTVKARPGERVPLRVLRIRPLAEPIANKNVYVVETEPVPGYAAPHWLLPGMTGQARIDALDNKQALRRASGWSLLLGPTIDQLRLWLWL